MCKRIFQRFLVIRLKYIANGMNTVERKGVCLIWLYRRSNVICMRKLIVQLPKQVQSPAVLYLQIRKKYVVTLLLGNLQKLTWQKQTPETVILNRVSALMFVLVLSAPTVRQRHTLSYRHLLKTAKRIP